MEQATALRLARAYWQDMNVTSVSTRSIARLWSGMGAIYHVSSTAAGHADFIIKYIHPRFQKNKGESSLSIGDQRKWDSYLVEANFYEEYAQQLRADHGVELPPPPYLVERQELDSIAMGILKCLDYNFDNVHERVLKWMANFHAATWNSSCDHLQPIASYWHLDTRPEEWKDVPRHGWEGRLKLAARAVHNRLVDRDPMQCMIHGDAKGANLLQEGARNIGYCDFQYVGRGAATKDIAYYLCSSHVDDPEEEEHLLNVYFEELCHHLQESGNRNTPTRQQFNDSLELAYCDFCRFMAGWGYWGCDIQARVQRTLDKLDQGRAFHSEADYEEAVERVFG